MFIEELWKKEPERVIKAIKTICKIDVRAGEQIYFEGQTKDGFRFGVYGGKIPYEIYISDFAIQWKEYEDEGAITHSYYNHIVVEWMKFMHKIYGDRYVQAFESYRKDMRDLYIAKYEHQFNNQTKKILSYLEINNNNDIQGQIK